MTISPEARLHAYEDALRGIAAAAVAARRGTPTATRLLTLLTDVEHHLSSLIVLGAVPPDTGRPVTSSAHLPLDGPRRLEE